MDTSMEIPCTQVLEDFLPSDSPQSSPEKKKQIGKLKINGTTYPIFTGENRIGRDAKACSIVLDGKALSAQHAMIEANNADNVFICDLESTNKTRLGKMILKPNVRYQLHDNAQLYFADVLATYHQLAKHNSSSETIDTSKEGDFFIPETPSGDVFKKPEERICVLESPSDDSIIECSQPVKENRSNSQGLGDRSNGVRKQIIFGQGSDETALESICEAATQLDFGEDSASNHIPKEPSEEDVDIFDKPTQCLDSSVETKDKSKTNGIPDSDLCDAPTQIVDDPTAKHEVIVPKTLPKEQELDICDAPTQCFDLPASDRVEGEEKSVLKQPESEMGSESIGMGDAGGLKKPNDSSEQAAEESGKADISSASEPPNTKTENGGDSDTDPEEVFGDNKNDDSVIDIFSAPTQLVDNDISNSEHGDTKKIKNGDVAAENSNLDADISFSATHLVPSKEKDAMKPEVQGKSEVSVGNTSDILGSKCDTSTEEEDISDIATQIMPEKQQLSDTTKRQLLETSKIPGEDKSLDFDMSLGPTQLVPSKHNDVVKPQDTEKSDVSVLKGSTDSDISFAPAQSVPSKENERIVKPQDSVKSENTNVDSDISTAPTQIIPSDEKNSIVKSEVSDKSDPSSTGLSDAPTQKIEDAGKSGSVQEVSEEPSDTPAKNSGTEFAKPESKKLDKVEKSLENSGSETDDDIFDLPTQKYEKKKPEVEQRPQLNKDSVADGTSSNQVKKLPGEENSTKNSDSDNDLFDAPTQVLGSKLDTSKEEDISDVATQIYPEKQPVSKMDKNEDVAMQMEEDDDATQMIEDEEVSPGMAQKVNEVEQSSGKSGIANDGGKCNESSASKQSVKDGALPLSALGSDSSKQPDEMDTEECDLFDAPTQIYVRKEEKATAKNTVNGFAKPEPKKPVGGPTVKETPVNDAADDIYDLPTQKYNHEDSAVESRLSIDESKSSDGTASKETGKCARKDDSMKSSDIESDIFDAPTQVWEPKVDTNKVEDISEMETQIWPSRQGPENKEVLEIDKSKEEDDDATQMIENEEEKGSEVNSNFGEIKAGAIDQKVTKSAPSSTDVLQTRDEKADNNKLQSTEEKPNNNGLEPIEEKAVGNDLVTTEENAEKDALETGKEKANKDGMEIAEEKVDKDGLEIKGEKAEKGGLEITEEKADKGRLKAMKSDKDRLQSMIEITDKFHISKEKAVKDGLQTEEKISHKDNVETTEKKLPASKVVITEDKMADNESSTEQVVNEAVSSKDKLTEKQLSSAESEADKIVLPSSKSGSTGDKQAESELQNATKVAPPLLKSGAAKGKQTEQKSNDGSAKETNKELPTAQQKVSENELHQVKFATTENEKVGITSETIKQVAVGNKIKEPTRILVTEDETVCKNLDIQSSESIDIKSVEAGSELQLQDSGSKKEETLKDASPESISIDFPLGDKITMPVKKSLTRVYTNRAKQKNNDSEPEEENKDESGDDIGSTEREEAVSSPVLKKQNHVRKKAELSKRKLSTQEETDHEDGISSPVIQKLKRKGPVTYSNRNKRLKVDPESTTPSEKPESKIPVATSSRRQPAPEVKKKQPEKISPVKPPPARVAKTKVNEEKRKSRGRTQDVKSEPKPVSNKKEVSAKSDTTPRRSSRQNETKTEKPKDSKTKANEEPVRGKKSSDTSPSKTVSSKSKDPSPIKSRSRQVTNIDNAANAAELSPRLSKTTQKKTSVSPVKQEESKRVRSSRAKREDVRESDSDSLTSHPGKTGSPSLARRTSNRRAKHMEEVNTDFVYMAASRNNSPNMTTKRKRDDTESESSQSDTTKSPRVSRSRGKKEDKPATPPIPASRGNKRKLEESKAQEVQPSPKRIRASRLNETIASSVAGSPTRASSRVAKIFRVLFTGVSCSKDDQDFVEKLGGSVVDTPDACNVLVTDKVRRTYKFLCIMGMGKPIVSLEWLKKSRQSGSFLDPWQFVVKDIESEKKFKFSLQKSLKTACQSPLLAGYSVMVTGSVKPPPQEMKGIITSSGGKVLTRAPGSSWPEKSFTISCPEDRSQWSKFKKGGRPIVGAEVLLLGVLQQNLDLKVHALH